MFQFVFKVSYKCVLKVGYLVKVQSDYIRFWCSSCQCQIVNLGILGGAIAPKCLPLGYAYVYVYIMPFSRLRLLSY